jgi:uncharacterized protein (DUF305 family)
MNRWDLRRIANALMMTGSLAACSATGQGGAPLPGPSAPATVVGRIPHTEADVHFMSGMIPHHAQAVRIATWAKTRAVRSDIRILSERIVVGQQDEIATMRNWLLDRGESAPAADATHLRMTMNGMEHDMLMPGMMTDEELAQLERASGLEFDRLFLTFMIRHHEGALTMVDQLFASPGAGQDDVVFKFASDVYADQSTEIERMEKMLADIAAGGDRH